MAIGLAPYLAVVCPDKDLFYSMKVYSEFPCPSIENIFVQMPETAPKSAPNANCLFVASDDESSPGSESSPEPSSENNISKYWGNTQFTWTNDVASRRSFSSYSGSTPSPPKRKYSEEPADSIDLPWSDIDIMRECYSDQHPGSSPAETEFYSNLIHYSTAHELYGYNENLNTYDYPEVAPGYDIDPCFRLKDIDEADLDLDNGTFGQGPETCTVNPQVRQALSTFEISRSQSCVSHDTEELSFGETSASEVSLHGMDPPRSSSLGENCFGNKTLTHFSAPVAAPGAHFYIPEHLESAYPTSFSDHREEVVFRSQCNSPQHKPSKSRKFDLNRAPYHIRKVLSPYPPDKIPPPDKFMLLPWALKAGEVKVPKKTQKQSLLGLPSAGLTATERLERFKQVHGKEEFTLPEGTECSHCNSEFDDLDTYMEHLDAYSVTHENFCPDENCVYSAIGFRFRWSLRRHICNFHLKDYNAGRDKAMPGGDAPEACDSDIEKHLSHVYVCKKDNCLRAFYRSDSLRRHQKLIHEVGPQAAPKKKKKRKLRLTSCDRDQFI